MLSKVKSELLNGIKFITLGAFLALYGGAALADSNIAGKKVIFVPISMGISLTEGWARRMNEHAARYGYSFEIRDAAFNTGAMSECLSENENS